MTQIEVIARPPSPVPINEDEMVESSTNNQLGVSYVADVQHSGSNVPFHCTDTMTCKHLTNDLTECLYDKVYNTFKDLFNDININSIQETYPKISIYNNRIVQFVEEKTSNME